MRICIDVFFCSYFSSSSDFLFYSAPTRLWKRCMVESNRRSQPSVSSCEALFFFFFFFFLSFKNFLLLPCLFIPCFSLVHPVLLYICWLNDCLKIQSFLTCCSFFTSTNCRFSLFPTPFVSGHYLLCLVLGVDPFRVMTYNVLAPRYLALTLMDSSSDWFREWSYRWKLVLEEVDIYEPDILCLQEIGGDILDTDVRPSLEQRGFDLVAKRRTSDEENPDQSLDACVIAWKKNRYFLCPVFYQQRSFSFYFSCELSSFPCLFRVNRRGIFFSFHGEIEVCIGALDLV